MHRLVLASVATLSLVGGVVGVSAGASGSTNSTALYSAVMEENSIVGTWILTDASDPEAVPFMGAFFADGIYVEVNDGDVGLGAWAATESGTVAMSYTSMDEGGSTFTVRASITVDGDSLSADYTLEVVAEGAPVGEFGPGQVTGTRVSAEPMGTPVGSIDDLFGGFDEGVQGSDPPTSG